MLTKTSAGKLCCLVGASFAMLGGCVRNSAAGNPLMGKWQGLTEKWRSIEFLQDGTVTQSTALSNKVLTKPGTYRVVDGTHLIITRRIQRKDAQSTDIPVEYRVSGDRLTIKAANGLTTEFEKAK